MKTFIHTCSISVNITWKESQVLQNRYQWMPLNKSYKGKNYDYSITQFCKNGLQIQVRRREKKEIKYDKRHRPFRMDLIITPYKLLYPDVHLGKILNMGQLREALLVLDKMIDRIEQETGIEIKYDYKIQRVDVTCDVETPSDIYSKEIIAAIKTARLPYGYKVPNLSETEKEFGWNAENASLFYNKNQGAYIKVYDKKENLRYRDEYQKYPVKGLVRYELSLLHKCLANRELLAYEQLGECLKNVMYSGEDLFQEYIIDNLYELPMFSLKVLEDYLDTKLERKEKTLEKMKWFCRTAYKCKKNGVPFTAVRCNMSEGQFRKCCSKFRELGISPIPADDACPYIPSIESMLNGKIENKLAYFADMKTRGKEIWIYEQG